MGMGRFPRVIFADEVPRIAQAAPTSRWGESRAPYSATLPAPCYLFQDKPLCLRRASGVPMQPIPHPLGRRHASLLLAISSILVVVTVSGASAVSLLPPTKIS